MHRSRRRPSTRCWWPRRAVLRIVRSQEQAVVTVTNIHDGEAFNVIHDRGELCDAMRALYDVALNLII